MGPILGPLLEETRGRLEGDEDGLSPHLRLPQRGRMDSGAREEFFELLSNTSRSFSVGILGLDSPLQDEVCLGYLVCRIFDTYEDSVDVKSDLRLACLRRSKDILLNINDKVRLEELLTDWELLHDFPAWDVPGMDPWELKLLRAGDRIWRQVAACPLATREAFRDSLEDMILGMTNEIERRQIQRDLQPRSLEETDRYCYSVAGTVGALLTRLFRGQGALSTDQTTSEEGIEFGKALQLVNIMKDFHKDWSEGRCYWPGLSLPTSKLSCPPALDQLEKSFDALKAQFSRYAAAAWSYVKKIDPQRRDLRFFCEFPLRMAEATLNKAVEDLSWLAEGGTFKVNRLEMAKILEHIN